MNERELAVYTLIDIFDEDAYNNIILKKVLDKSQLEPNKKAFVTELVNGTLRNLIFIDYVINQFSKTNTKKMKPLILNILRTSVYQVIFMDKVPVSAICNEAVKFTKKKNFVNLSGFVNGVLRNIARAYESKSIVYPSEKNKVDYISTMFSYPKWLIEYWILDMKYEDLKEMCISNNKSPKVTICINTLKTSKESIIKILEKDKVTYKDGNILDESLLISKVSDISNNIAFKQGLFHVMDESSMLAIKALNLKSGENLLDVCAAPGGKSFFSSYLMKNSGEIYSRDIYDHKIQLMKESIKRLSLNNITPQLKDATKFYKEDEKKYDKIIVDAPCSGFGLLRKKPDIKYRKSMDSIDSLVEIQRKILMNVSKYLKLGGILLYSTCTVSKKENEDNINWFLHNNDDYELVKIQLEKNEKFNEKFVNNKGYIQILPHYFDTDGFFIAMLKRKG